MRNKKRGRIISWIAVVLAVIIFCSCFIFTKIEVVGPSMYPTLKSGDYGVADSFTYKIFGLHRFDIVTVNVSDGKTIVKRIVGLPGEEIFYDDEGLHVDGVLVDEPFLEEGMKQKTANTNCPLTTTGVKLGEDEYYVLGDNRDNSTDSRFIGPVIKDRIKARGFIIYGELGDKLKLPRFVGW